MRVGRCGGRIELGRVNGKLAVTRAFGNKHLKACVTADPETRTVSLEPADDYLLLASDGLWDVVDETEAFMVIEKQAASGKGLREAAKALTRRAIASGSMDNVTVVVVRVEGFANRSTQGSIDSLKGRARAGEES